MPNKAILIRPIYPDAEDAAIPPMFRVTFQGVREGHKGEVEFWDVTQGRQEQKLASVKGHFQRRGGKPESPLFMLNPESSPPPAKKETPQCGLVFATTGDSPVYYLDLPSESVSHHEGATWHLQARIKAALPHAPDTHSATFPVTHRRRVVPARFAPTRAALGGWPMSNAATYDWHAGNDLKFYHDASTDATGSEGAFHDMLAAIKDARHFIYIADWSFHPAMRILRGSIDVKNTIGAVLIEQARKYTDMRIAIHTWTHVSQAADEQNNDAKNVLTLIAANMDPPGQCPTNLLWRSTERKGLYWSHHQKFIVMDSPANDGRREIKAFYGGLDLAKGRFDWPEHLIFSDESGASDLMAPVAISDPGYDDWYNAEFDGPAPAQNKAPPHEPWQDINKLPREPWHDIHAQITGPTAWDVVREFVGRWQHNASWWGREGDKNDKEVKKMFLETLMTWKPPPDSGDDLLSSSSASPDFVQQWEPRKGAWAGQVLRSLDKRHWDYPETNAKWNPSRTEFKWRVGGKFERSIQDAYLHAIAQAQEYIYIETQYFSGEGADNPIPAALSAKVVERIQSGQPFHLYLLMPMYPEGSPDDSTILVRIGEWHVLESVIATIDQAAQKVSKTWKDFFTLGYLARSLGTENGELLTLSKCTSKGKDRRKELLQHNRRNMIYIHSKLMIVDDRYLILGSANLNKRSIAGDRDSEICIAVWPGSPEAEAACIAQIAALRQHLWEEHLPYAPQGKPNEHECVEAFQQAANDNHTNFYTGKPTTSHFMQWQFTYNAHDGLKFPHGFEYIPDGLDNDGWRWRPKHIPLKYKPFTDIAL